MITTKEGNILEATEVIIAHQVNCFGVAGGLAAAVFDAYPAAERDYMQLVERAQPWRLKGIAQMTGQQQDGHIIANLFGQYHPGADYRPGDLKAALRMLAQAASRLGVSVALPYKISCGICGGDWEEVFQMIEETMEAEGVECAIYRRKGD